MKTITRKQAKQAIESKGLQGALRIGKLPLTAKQKRFAENLVLQGLNSTEAYREAYDHNGKPQTASVEAWKLKQNPKVAQTIQALEQAKELATLHSAESLKALVISTLTDIATNSDKDSVRVQAVKTLGTVVGVDMFRETKRIETVKDSSEIREQILGQLKTMMLNTSDAQEVDANDLLSELTGSDPTHTPPPQNQNGTPTLDEHTIPHEHPQQFSDLDSDPQSPEHPPVQVEALPPPGDIFLENEQGYQVDTGSASTLRGKK